MFEVSPARPDERIAAVALLFATQPPAEQAAHTRELLEAAALGTISLEGLFVARNGREIAGSLLYLRQPDGTAYVWPPATGTAWSEPVADALLVGLTGVLDESDDRFAQCLLESGADLEQALLERHGFSVVAELDYLQRPLKAQLPDAGTTRLTTIPFDPDRDAERFASVIEQTYQGTLDCPNFLERRSGADALASHRLAGRFDPQRWSIYRDGDQDVGLLLVSDHPDWNAHEVVYMGVVPAARGRGLGEIMVRDALHAARRAGREAVFLAVDRRNVPARKIYERLGFVAEGTRTALIRTRPPQSGGK